jgi:hypothetical protein
MYALASPNLDGERRPLDAEPKYPHDPKITSCNWWYDSDGSKSCSEVAAEYGTSESQIQQLVSNSPIMISRLADCHQNPNLSVACGKQVKIPASTSICVEPSENKGDGTGSQPGELTSVGPTKTIAAPPSITTSPNGIATPKPVQKGIQAAVSAPAV